MPNMGDMARMMAASGGMPGMDGGPVEDPGQVEAMAPNDQQDPIAEMSGALDAIEGAAAGLPPEMQDKMRQHIEALRALTEEASTQVAQEQPQREPAAGQEPMPAAGGADEGIQA